MRIGLDCRLIDLVHNTGISRYTEFLIEYYVKNYGSENIYLITNDTKFQYRGCSMLYTRFKPFYVHHFLRFGKYLDKLNLDLIHIPFYSGVFKKRGNTIIIVTVHDLMYRIVDGFLGESKILSKYKIMYFDFIVERSLRNADLVVTVSETSKRDVYDAFGVNSVVIPEVRVKIGEEDMTILSKFNLESKNFFFYCGNNRPHKNISFLKNVFKNNIYLPPLVLAGKDHESCTNVIATGVVSEEQLTALYRSAIAFIFPSRYEGFGLPVLEALGHGTLVIASNIPAFLEFKSENILYFELDNVNEFLNAVEVSEKSSFQVENLYKYDKEKIYIQYEELLKDLLNLTTKSGL